MDPPRALRFSRSWGPSLTRANPAIQCWKPFGEQLEDISPNRYELLFGAEGKLSLAVLALFLWGLEQRC